MKLTLSSLLVALSALILTACPSKNDGTAGTTCNTTLSGTFKDACYLQSPGVYAVDTLVTNGTTLQYTVATYSDAACGTTTGSSTLTGILTVGSASSAVSGATNVDVTPDTGQNIGCGVNGVQYSIYAFNSSCQLVLGEAAGAATGCGSAANRHANLASSQRFDRQ